MTHPDTPPSKARANRLPSKGPGHGGPAKGHVRLGGAPGGETIPWEKGVLQPQTGRAEMIRKRLSKNMEKYLETLEEVAANADHPAWNAANHRAIELYKGPEPKIIGVKDLDKPGRELTDAELWALVPGGPVIEGDAE